MFVTEDLTAYRNGGAGGFAVVILTLRDGLMAI